jgi:hypothetical protein
MDIKKKIIEDIRVLQESIKEDIDFYCIGTNILDPNVKRNARISNPYILMDEDLLELHKRLLIYRVESKEVTQEAFNEIADLRPYLINSPKDYTQDCLHYLGDAAQKWWWEKKFMEGYEKVMTLIDSEKTSKAFEVYLRFETVEIYRKIALELKEQYDSSYSEMEQELIGSGFLSILSLSKKHHLK